jgi:voltage-gated potassium channel
MGAIGICGEGSTDEVLEAAGVRFARGIAICTPSTAVNVFVTLSARELQPGVYIVTRIDDHDAASKARRAGADEIVSPFRSGGSRIAHALRHRHAAAFVERVLGREFGELELDDVEVGKDSPLVGTIGSLRVRFGVATVAIRHGDGRLATMPTDDDPVLPGSVLVVLGTPASLASLKGAILPR